jgi:NADH-quinone oxidoreductase subunit G
MDWDGRDSRTDFAKVHKPKAVDLGPTIVLDAERCILCTRCIRVCDEVAGEHQLEMAWRGDHEILSVAPGKQLDNPYSLNTVDVCPVGALTSKDFRFQMRAWELYTMPSVCPGCATGCNIEVQHSRGQVYRLIPRINPAVNKHWMCDEGRFTYKRTQTERLVAPTSGGTPVDWDRALDDAGRALSAVVGTSPYEVGVVFNAQSTNEDL